jgi:4-hydroxy-tetrahydrodipicolinate reductase
MDIIISGALGAMGRVVANTARMSGFNVVAGVDREGSDEFSYPVFDGFINCTEKADVIIDFSHPSTLLR